MNEKLNFDTDEIQLIAFKLGNEEYTVPIETVQEIIMPQKTTHMPKAPAFLEGVINLRGHVIPIIDGRKRFDIPPTNSEETRIIILELEDHTLGLIVDAVSEVVYLQTSLIEAPPIEIDQDNEFILGVGKFKDRLLILLEPTKFLSHNEIKTIQKIHKPIEEKELVTEVETLAKK